VFLTFLVSCSGSQLQVSQPPSPKALKGIRSLGIDRVTGSNASFFRVLLRQNIQKSPYFNLAEDLSMLSKRTGVLNAEILLYSVRDEKEDRNLPRVQLLNRGSSGLSQKGQPVFEFVSKDSIQKLVHRTLDLQIRIQVLSHDLNRTLYESTERISFQQSYKGKLQIQNMPDPSSERLRLGQLLIQRSLDKMAPQEKQHVLTLEKGTAPLPWTFGLISVEHPGINSGNRHALAREYMDALKKWHYVLFKPEGFPSFESFTFDDRAYVRFKKEGLPDFIIQKLLKLYGNSFSSASLDQVLKKLLEPSAVWNYGPTIKAHARTAWEKDLPNLASTHYNIALIYKLHKKLKLASYHLARANALNPNEKYAQAWTDLQYEMGSFDPLDSMLNQNIETAGELPPPETAMISPRASSQGKSPVRRASLRLIPVELPQLFTEPDPQLSKTAVEIAPIQKESDPALQLD